VGTALLPEAKLLVECARVPGVPEGGEGVAARREEIDWADFLRMASYHGVTPLVLRSLPESDVPAQSLERLRASVRGTGLHALVLTGELFRLLDLFANHAIPVIPYKGPVVAFLAYGDLALRPFSDLDFLLRRRDIPRATSLLVARGYRVHPRLRGTREAAYRGSQRHYSFRRGDGILVELHWRIAPGYFSLPRPPEAMWQRLQPVSFRGREVRTFSPEDTLLVLCSHGAYHLWERLTWVCDVARLVTLRPSPRPGTTRRPLRWETLLENAATLHCRRTLFLGLFLAQTLLGASLPPEVTHEVNSDPSVRLLASRVRRRLFESPPRPVGLLPRWRFHFQLRDRPRDRLSYSLRYARHVLRPMPWEWELLPLPDFLFPLYYLLRPLRLTAK
jgi:hypothetical protein